MRFRDMRTLSRLQPLWGVWSKVRVQTLSELGFLLTQESCPYPMLRMSWEANFCQHQPILVFGSPSLERVNKNPEEASLCVRTETKEIQKSCLFPMSENWWLLNKMARTRNDILLQVAWIYFMKKKKYKKNRRRDKFNFCGLHLPPQGLNSAKVGNQFFFFTSSIYELWNLFLPGNEVVHRIALETTSLVPSKNDEDLCSFVNEFDYS